MHEGKRRLSSNPKSVGYFSDSQDFELISKTKKTFTKISFEYITQSRKHIWIRDVQETQAHLCNIKQVDVTDLQV